MTNHSRRFHLQRTTDITGVSGTGHVANAGDCPHCPDGHTPADSGSQTWVVHVADDRDGDGQPTHLIVARSGGAHVAESDAQWIRARINPAEEPPPAPQPHPYTGRTGRGA